MKPSYMTSNLVLVILFMLLLTSVSAQKVKNNELQKDAVPLQNITPNIVLLEPVSYEYNKADQYKKLRLPSGQQYGLIAEDVEKVFPHLVKTSYRSVMTGKNSYKSVAVKTIDYNGLIPLLIASVKEQQEEIETLKGQLQQLKVAAR